MGRKHSLFSESLGKSKIDKSGYSNLYQFSSREELAEYSLPFYNIATAETPLSKLPMKSARLPPILKSPQVKMDLEDINQNITKIEEKEEEDRKFSIEEEIKEKTDKQFEGNRTLDYADLARIFKQNIKGDTISKSQNLFLEKGTKLFNQLLKIKTGDEAIEFFAKYGNSTAIKFINCNKAINSQGLFRPYDLTVVLQDRNSEVFIF